MRLDFPDLGGIDAERVSLPPPSSRLLAGLAQLHGPALLDSAAGGRFTVIGAMPLARLTWTAQRGEISLPGGARPREDDFGTLLRAALGMTATHSPIQLPYGPGWIGCFGYGLRTAFENVPGRHADDTGIPDVSLAYYPAVAVHDAVDRCWWFVWRRGAADQVRTLRACLRHAASAPPGRVTSPVEPLVSREQYLSAVRRAVEYIHAGDVFQVNYAHEFRAGYEGHPLALYLALREHNPAPYGAYLETAGGRAILSTSPELFLSLRGTTVSTRPIKGTRPRGQNEAEDAAQADALRRSEKDAAELAMIVDLERNDLGRVCRPGTIRVTEKGTIEPYASVWHRVAEVVGEIEDGVDRAHLIAAAFPGGSITGAPKVRAMQIIDELEAGRRGPYTGSIGMLPDGGGLELNIAIRTPVVAAGQVRVWVGGGIVADSDPEAEYEETLDKGRAMFRAFGEES